MDKDQRAALREPPSPFQGICPPTQPASRRRRYRFFNVSEFVASRDLKRLTEVDLLTPLGEKRGRTYEATEQLRDIRRRNRFEAAIDDPYEIVGRPKPAPPQPSLPLE